MYSTLKYWLFENFLFIPKGFTLFSNDLTSQPLHVTLYDECLCL